LTIAIILVSIAFIFIIIAQVKKAEVIISPMIGFVIGSLYNRDLYEDEEEITLQCLLGVISITVIWINRQNG
jgi:hypothetical protein